MMVKLFCSFDILETRSANIYVSNRATKEKDCGMSEDDPCRTISAAVEIDKKGLSQITIISTGKKYQDCPILVNRPLAFKGLYGRPVIDCGGGDAFIFKFVAKRKRQASIKLDVSNLKLQNSKAGFKFLGKTSFVNLRLENITFANNEVDVTWSDSPLCFLVMTNVYSFGRSGNAVEIKGCIKTILSLVKTKLHGKYFKVLSTLESYILKINMNEVTFDMSSRANDSSKEVPSLSPVDIVTALKKTSITITSSTFLNHHGHRNGMISVTGFKKSKKGGTPINIKFFNVSFMNSTALRGVGGAASFNITNKLNKTMKHSIIFKRCIFTGNAASNGGAVWFSSWGKKSVQFLECTFEDNKAHDKVEETGSGGALFALSGKFAITKCKFIGNAATKSGGTLYLFNKDVTTILITDSVFQNVRRSWSRIEGYVMYLNDVQTTFRERVIFNLSSANSGKPILLYEGRPTTLRMDNTSNFICPKGYNYNELKYTLATKRTKPDYISSYHVFAFSCKPCPDLFYSTSRGSWLANGTETRGKCHACPYGASCNGTIRAIANFWGETREDKVEMIPCPKGYCCDREPCESYDSCRAHRTGRLCGHCSEGFTEGLSSTQCFPNEKCNGASWMWLMLSVIGIFIFFCFHQEVR